MTTALATPTMPATTHSRALLSALTSSQIWVDAFNRGDLAHCADTYTETALLEAKPFGTFNGREAIRAFWADLLSKGARQLNYEHIKLDQLDARTMILSARWTMNIGGGVISVERWEEINGRWMLTEDRFEVLTQA
ncbi:nuclear transport factor 2 family protein [Ideonella sp.]|uniref:nuclear transport factor 2 family protein n=1 Tax=Ideonella sp. TaxID=1929293 RepID=UPI0037BEEEC3